MVTVLKLAWRSIWRNRRRTLISMSAAALGLTLVIVYSGLIAGVYSDAKRALDNSAMGHVEITAATWRAKGQPALAMADTPELLARLDLPPKSDVSARVITRGLASSAHGSEGVEVHGVDWRAEATTAAYVNDVRQGSLPAAGDLRGILIGEELARKLKVQLGGKLRLMAQRTDGEMGADLYRVRGIFHASSPMISERRVLVSAASAQALIDLPGGAHQIVIQLDDPDSADVLAAGIGAALGQGYEVLAYQQLVPMMKQLEDLVDNAVVIAAVFVYLLVGLGILNTSLMSVLERTREFGVMLAVGTRPKRIVSLVLAESFWIATLSVIVGAGLGVLIVWYGQHHLVLDFSQAMGEGMDIGGMVVKAAFNTKLSVPKALQATLFVYLMALVVGLFPALRVSKLHPAEALRRT